MKRVGAWSETPPPPEAFEDMGPFGMKTMSYEQWLEFVFLARVRALLESDGPWPESSAVGTQAVRSFDGWPEAGELIRLLGEFDRFFDEKTPDPAARAHYERGDTLWQKGPGGDALAELLRAVEIDPRYPNAQNYAGWILTKFFPNDPEAMARGIRLLEGARALSPEDTKPLYNLGDALVATGRADRAMEVVAEALRQSPSWPEAHNYAGWLQAIAADDLARGIAHLEQAISLRPWYGDAHFNLGRAPP